MQSRWYLGLVRVVVPAREGHLAAVDVKALGAGWAGLARRIAVEACLEHVDEALDSRSATDCDTILAALAVRLH